MTINSGIILFFMSFLFLSCTKEDTEANKSSDAFITSFNIGSNTGLISDKDIKVEVPSGTDLTKLKADVKISDKATISPDPTIDTDYTNSVDFTITAEDGTTKNVYKVEVSEKSINTVPSVSKKISGFAQKGPFVPGSILTANELTSSLSQTGKVFNAKLKNYEGEFDIDIKGTKERYFKMMVDGLYFNEFNGVSSNSKVSLLSLVDIKTQSSINVNILTHMQYDRVKKLMSDGKTYKEARKQSMIEIGKSFYFKEADVKDLDPGKVKISDEDKYANILISISVIMLYGRTDVEFSEALSKYSADLADNGVIDDANIKKEIADNSYNIHHEGVGHIKKIVRNIEKYYKDKVNKDIKIDELEYYIDHNLDEILDNNDSPFKFDFKTKTITGLKAGECKKDIIIPSKIGGVDVDNIGNYAFYDCQSLTTITIPNSLTKIGESAFSNCKNLKVVNIDQVNSKLSSIGKYSFYDCENLTAITIPNSLTSIGDRTFGFCKNLKAVNIDQANSKLSSISNYAFYNCENLTKITIPNSVISIEENAFGYCKDLKAVNIDQTNSKLSSIGNDAFYDIDGLITITIPNSLTSIGDRTFGFCKNLKAVNIDQANSKLSSIGIGAFIDCKSLETIVIPNSVTSVGDNAFEKCENLKAVNIDQANSKLSSIGDKLFYTCKSLTAITIPNSLTSIGENAFEYCEVLKTVDIDQDNSKLDSISIAAFSYCESLTSINIPNSLTKIGADAFYNCKDLKIVDIDQANSKLKSIDGAGAFYYGAFYGCKSLTKITIPNSLTKIGEKAFDECENLKAVNIDKDNSKLSSIGKYAFRSCKSLTTINIPNSVTFIGKYAFRSCESLTTITIPNAVTSIFWGTFRDCKNLTTITIPNSVTSIGKYAFYNVSCYNITVKIIRVIDPSNTHLNSVISNLNPKCIDKLLIPSASLPVYKVKYGSLISQYPRIKIETY